jgi:hypothetical protein
MTARTPASRATNSNASSNSPITAEDRAFNFSGRFTVINATPEASTSTRMCWKAM